MLRKAALVALASGVSVTALVAQTQPQLDPEVCGDIESKGEICVQLIDGGNLDAAEICLETYMWLIDNCPPM